MSNQTISVKMFCVLSAILFIVGFAAARVAEPGKAISEPAIPDTVNPQYVISVSISGEKIGDIVIELLPKFAPKHVRNFDSLVAVMFYNGTLFHRIIPGFMIQGGDPGTKTKPRENWGNSDPTLTKVPAEFSELKHHRGAVSAARGKNINSASTQFFICVDERSDLDGNYSVFGNVLSGMEVADKIVELSRDEGDRPIERVEMKIAKR